ERGLDISLDNLGYSGKRHDVSDYLQALGWSTAGTRMGQLLAENGLPLPLESADRPALLDNYYCTAVRQKAGAS
ncbi:MAG: SAM-dependent methyltransferase, partial [Mycobacteriaceae bacterium]|nr:SAM-dependent methyltransferase [Mycobacteriaceae bacterium]